MAYFRVNIQQELKKAAKGKKTKMPVGQVLYESLRDYPAIQKLIGEVFEITEG
jgi:hypothetical protein